MTVNRIHWEPAGYGAFAGHVGTTKDRLFMIRKPDHRPAWRLSSPLPGLSGAEATSAGPDALKREAERWLEEFVTSLGAVFPEALCKNCRHPIHEVDYSHLAASPPLAILVHVGTETQLCDDGLTQAESAKETGK